MSVQEATAQLARSIDGSPSALVSAAIGRRPRPLARGEARAVGNTGSRDPVKSSVRLRCCTGVLPQRAVAEMNRFSRLAWRRQAPPAPFNIRRRLPMNPIHRTALAALVGAAAAGGAFAAAPVLPAQQHQGSVAFVTGGVGKDEAQAFEQAEKQYPLTLEFVRRTKPHEEFMADVPVTIKDASGAEIVSTTAQGPFFLAKLPPGNYKVSASHDGKTQERMVRIGATGHDLVVFSWAG
jgi:hypothetical protein